MALSGNTLYGTTLEGGTNGGGTVYSINTNGGNFTVLHSSSSPNNNGLGVFTNIGGRDFYANPLPPGVLFFGVFEPPAPANRKR